MEKLISEKELPDALWKAIVTEMLPDFIDFFIPELYEVIDFNRGFEFLEQELEKIIKKSKKHRKYTDKLVKVYLKDGKEQWILIHIELQGYHDEDFGERMFTMFYRIYDRFQRKTVALAIFTDGEAGYQSDRLDYDYFQTILHFEYFSYKILEQKEEELIKSENPFAMAVLAGLYTLKTEGKSRSKAETRYEFKKRLSKLLKERGYSEKKFIDLMSFIDGIMFLPDELEIEYEKEVKEEIGGGQDMVPMELTNLYRTGINIGRKEGIEEGIEKGIEKIVLTMLENGMSIEMVEKMTGMDRAKIEELSKEVKHN